MEEDTLEEYAFLAYHKHFRIEERRTQQRHFHTHKIDLLASVHPWCSVVYVQAATIDYLSVAMCLHHGLIGCTLV